MEIERSLWPVTALLLAIAVGLLVYGDTPAVLFVVSALAIVGTIVGKIPAAFFVRRIDWGRLAAFFCLMPALLAVSMIAAFLWFLVTPDELDVSRATLAGLTALSMFVVFSSLNSLRSREHPAAIAFRKKLAAGREFFKAQLRSERPSLQDSWYP